jgi:AraC-like DNA-binding protein/mannose-6-phosphate isomerase-like protein (cupin superfamily)
MVRDYSNGLRGIRALCSNYCGGVDLKLPNMRPKLPSHTTRTNSSLKGALARSVARPVSALTRSDKTGVVIALHRHSRHQLIYAIRGVMTIEAKQSIWTVPPSHALWMPAEVEHSIRMDTSVEMRTLYFQPKSIHMSEKDCSVLAVTPLLRELIVRAMVVAPHYKIGSRDERLMLLLTDEVSQLKGRQFSLRMPTDRRLQHLCEHLLRDLSQTRTIAQLGQLVGLSERSVVRLFTVETGLTPSRWRQQARLMHAFVLTERGLSMTRISTELGYSTVSAFSKMFSKVFGETPRTKFARLLI